MSNHDPEMPLDYDLVNDLTDLIKDIVDTGAIHRGFLRNPECAGAIEGVAKNIQTEQNNLWQEPETSILHEFTNG